MSVQLQVVDQLPVFNPFYPVEERAQYYPPGTGTVLSCNIVCGILHEDVSLSQGEIPQKNAPHLGRFRVAPAQ